MQEYPSTLEGGAFDPQRDLDILRTLRDAIHSGTHPLFRVPSTLQALPVARDEAPTPAPLIVDTPPAPVPAPVPSVQQDTDSVVSYEDLDTEQEQHPLPIAQEEDPGSDSDSDSDADSDLEVAAQLIQPLARLRSQPSSQLNPTASTSAVFESATRVQVSPRRAVSPSLPASPRAVSQASEVLILSSDTESVGDLDDVIIQDRSPVPASLDPAGPNGVSSDSPTTVPPSEPQQTSESRSASPAIPPTVLDPDPVCEKALSDKGSSTLGDSEMISSELDSIQVETGGVDQQLDVDGQRLVSEEHEQEAQQREIGFVPTPTAEEELAARHAREREAAAAPTRGISVPIPDRKETRGERKDREAREVAEKRARDKAEKEARERGGDGSSSNDSTRNQAEQPPLQHMEPVKNVEQAPQHRQPAPPTQAFAPPPHVQARLKQGSDSSIPRVPLPPRSPPPPPPSSGFYSDSRGPPPPVASQRRPHSPSRIDRRRSLSPSRHRPVQPDYRTAAPAFPPRYGSAQASGSHYPPPPPRGRSPVPLPPRGRSSPPPSSYPDYLPRNRAGSLTRSIDGARRPRSRSPPPRRAPAPPHAIDDRRCPAPVDDRRYIEDYRRDVPPPLFERDYLPPPPLSYRGPPSGPPPLSIRSRSRSPPPRGVRALSPLRKSGPPPPARYPPSNPDGSFYAAAPLPPRTGRSPAIGSGHWPAGPPIGRLESWDDQERRYGGGYEGAPPVPKFDDRSSYTSHGRPMSPPPSAARGGRELPPRRAPSPPPPGRAPRPDLDRGAPSLSDWDYDRPAGPPPTLLDRAPYRDVLRRYDDRYHDHHPAPLSHLPTSSSNYSGLASYDYYGPPNPRPVSPPNWRPYDGGVGGATQDRRGGPPPPPRGSPPSRRR